MSRRIITIGIVLFLFSENAAMAQAETDSLSVTVLYPCGSSNIAKIPENTKHLNRFIHQLDSVFRLPDIIPFGLFVTSSTSPEGNIRINQTLSRKRNQAVIDYLNHHSEHFKTISSSLDGKLHEQTNNHRLGKIPLSAYPSMRHSKVTLYIRKEKKDSIPVLESSSPDTIPDSLSSTILIEKEAEPTPSVLSQETYTHTTVSRPLFFVKSNLLYDLLTFVNASVEIPLSKRLTAEATLVYPWWRNTAKHKTVQMRYVAVTPRYYFKDADEPYTSFFAGLTVGTGSYDLQWTRRGVQGTMWHVSPMFGYAHYIGKRWKMEYSASVGYLHTAYKKYTQTADTPYGEIKVRDYPWVSKVLRTVLPTSLNVSLVYTFNQSKPVQHHER